MSKRETDRRRSRSRSHRRRDERSYERSRSPPRKRRRYHTPGHSSSSSQSSRSPEPERRRPEREAPRGSPRPSPRPQLTPLPMVEHMLGIKDRSWEGTILDFEMGQDERRRLRHEAPSLPPSMRTGDLGRDGPETLTEAVDLGVTGVQYIIDAVLHLPERTPVHDRLFKGLRLIMASLTKSQEERFRQLHDIPMQTFKQASEAKDYPKSVKSALAWNQFFRNGPGDSKFPGAAPHVAAGFAGSPPTEPPAPGFIPYGPYGSFCPPFYPYPYPVPPRPGLPPAAPPAAPPAQSDASQGADPSGSQPAAGSAPHEPRETDRRPSRELPGRPI
jgi:hypothetical protein